MNPRDVDKEMSILQEKGDSIQRYSHKRIAHLIEEDILLATFKELDECLDYLEKLREKYHTLLCGNVPVFILDWPTRWQVCLLELKALGWVKHGDMPPAAEG